MDNLQEQTPQYQVSRLAIEQTHLSGTLGILVFAACSRKVPGRA